MVHSGPLELEQDELLRLHVFVDRSILEVFANGRLCMTSRIYPTRPDSTGIGLFATGGSAMLRSMEVWSMNPIWPTARTDRADQGAGAGRPPAMDRFPEAETMDESSTPKVLLNDRLVEKSEAVIPLDTVAFKYGAMVFEGLRAYWNEQTRQLNVFRLDDHSRRLEQSVRVMRMDTALRAGDYSAAVVRALRSNRIQATSHVRQMVYVDGPGEAFVTGPVSHAVIVTPKRGMVRGKGVGNPRLHQLLAADFRHLHSPASQVRGQLPKRPPLVAAGPPGRI